MSAHVEPEKENHERWVLSYADLVTLLLGFFIILYATSQLDVDKFKLFAFGLNEAFNTEIQESANGGSPLFDGGSGIIPGGAINDRIDRELELIRQAVDERTEAAGLSAGQINVVRNDDSVIIRLADNLLFQSASAAIRPGALPLLDVVGSVILELANEVRVEGHTDNVPVGTSRYPTNWELSSARATAALRYLVEGTGIDASRIFAAGYGEFRPVATNATPEGRALNRRADIVVIYPSGEVPEDLLGLEIEGE